MSEKTYYQRNRDVILNRAKDYYENDKERLREQAREIQKLIWRRKKQKEGILKKNRHHNMSGEKKQRRKE